MPGFILEKGTGDYLIDGSALALWNRLCVYINGAPVGTSQVSPRFIEDRRKMGEVIGVPGYIALKDDEILMVWPTPDENYEMRPFPEAMPA